MAIPPKITTLMNPVVRQQVPSWTRMLLAPTIRAFEEAVLIPLLPEYDDAFDYYDWNTPLATMPGIAVPTLIISSADDPITPPPPTGTNQGNVAVATVKYGGHLGFFQADLWATSWADGVCAEFCGEVARRVEVRERERGGGREGEEVARREGEVVIKRSGSLRGAALGF